MASGLGPKALGVRIQGFKGGNWWEGLGVAALSFRFAVQGFGPQHRKCRLQPFQIFNEFS